MLLLRLPDFPTRRPKICMASVKCRREKKELKMLRTSVAIRESIEKIAHLKDRSLLSSLGIDCSESESASESESDGVDENPSLEEELSNSISDRRLEAVVTGDGVGGAHSCSTLGTGSTMSFHQILDVFKSCAFNWFELVSQLKSTLDVTDIVIDKLLGDFGDQLTSMGLNDSDQKAAEQSRQAYLLMEITHSKNSDDGDTILSDSDSSEQEIWCKGVTNVLDVHGRELIKKRREALRRKTVRYAKRRVMEQRFLKRRRSKKVSRILSQCPDIGKEIEKFVQESGAGADAWRRTGVLTFDGNRKLKKKPTFKRIQQHLQEKYKIPICYGSVVQLCIARNKRRKSAARYKGVAKVLQKRSRKGFNAKFNPDEHWSCAFYSTLNDLQYKDGMAVMNIGRDDQAGFRLDTMTTHRLQGALCIKGKEALTTRTDYTTKYPSTLQTTSYNFAETETVAEMCVGIVKARGLYEKNPAQHLADLEMLSEKDELKPAFVDPKTSKLKKVQFIRVDGGHDEGPSHCEVQYWWTAWHLKTEAVATIVTCRNSGASFRNRVELQNGCLSLAHTNLFIPSTLNGSCMANDGKVNQEKLQENLSSAIDVYISRVNGAPCGSTQIELYRGANNTEYQKENEFVKIFLKGKKEAKHALEKDHPEMHAKIKGIWELKKRHVNKDVPGKYVFSLVCCYQRDCIHPLCKEGHPGVDPTWYPGGPPLTYFPLPEKDTERPFGQENCSQCKSMCSGHYLKSNLLVDAVINGRRPAPLQPPSDVILSVYKKYKDIPPDNVIIATSEDVLLPVDETRMWFQHLHQVSLNRKRGAKKAGNTRSQKTAKENQPEAGDQDQVHTLPTLTNQEADGQDQEIQEACAFCGRLDPLVSEALNCDSEEVNWVACDGCLCWFHAECCGLENSDIGSISNWLCIYCNDNRNV